MTQKEQELLKRIEFLEKENKLLKNSKTKYFENILEKIPFGVFFYDINGNIKWCNNKFFEIIGTTKDKMKGVNVFNDLNNIGIKQGVENSLNSGEGSYLGYYKAVTGKNAMYARGTFIGIRNEIGEIIEGVCVIEDLTEKYNYKTEVEGLSAEFLNANKNNLTIFHNSPIPIVVHQNGKIKLANEAAREFSRQKNDLDFDGQPISNLVHKDFLGKAYKNIENILNGGKSEVQTQKYLRLNGEARDVLSKSGLFFIDNEPAVLVAFVDVTKYKENENKLNIIIKGIETSTASVVITDENGNIEYVNPKFSAVTGFSKEYAIGKTSRIIKSDKYSKIFYEKMWKTILSGESWRGELLNLNKYKKHYWEYAIISPIFNDEGEITNFIAIKEDITERKEIEQKSIKNERYFKTLFETAPDGIFEINNEGIIVNCNKEFANSVGSLKSEIIGSYANKYIVNRDLFKKLFQQLKETGIVESELEQLNFDGTTTIVWRKVSAIYDKENNFSGALVYNRDITKIKETEKQLIDAKNKAEESDKLKSAFLSNMSHEIRTPLNAIVGFSKLISKGSISFNEKYKYIDYINQNSKLLLNLINDIIDISKIEANQLNIYKTDFMLNDLFKELFSTYLAEISCLNKDIEFVLNIPQEKIFVNTDELRLKQIVINLITNSIKFTEKGKIEIGFKTLNNSINIFVKDTGIGIPEENIESIFYRFERAVNTENKHKGTGLGLAIVKNLLAILGGTISVKSKRNIGSEFIVEFPTNIIVEKSKKTNIQQEYINNNLDWSGKTILVAEDDEFNFLVLNGFLKDFNIDVLYAKNGEEAISIYKKNKEKIDIILMDIQMPKVDGYQAIKEILKINIEAKIIAQTAFAMSDEKNDSINAGCIDFITKPIDADLLKLLLQNYLQ